MNLQLFNFIHQFAGQNVIFDLIGRFFAEYVSYILVLMVVILFFKQIGWKNRFYFFALAALSTLLARGIITETFRFFYNHPRPFDVLGFQPLIPESGNSFPSGHMTFFFALFLVVFYTTKDKNVAWWFLGLTVAMGLARIYCGVHWPADIFGGAIIGLLSAWAVRKILPQQEVRESVIE